MSVEPQKASRRRRKAPRRVPAIIEESAHRPFIFGWGADLSTREREAVKERIALFAGIALAILVAAILGAGAIYDNIIRPGQVSAQNNRPIAAIGNYVVRTGFFKQLESFENKQLTSQLTQLQQEAQTLSANKTKNAAQLAQVSQQEQQLQSSLSSLPQSVLTEVTNDQIALQRGYTVGVPNSAKEQASAITAFSHQLGGRLHYQQFIDSSGLTADQIKMLIVGSDLQSKIQKKLAAKVSRTQLEVRARHILIAPKQKALAERLYHKVLHGANFAALAKKYSTDPGSKVKGGDLGYFPKGQMVPTFDKAAFSMKKGQIRLIKSRFGWHILQVTGRKTATLSATQYQQAQATAYTTWQTRQKAILHVQNFISLSSLPAIPTATAVPGQQPVVPPVQPQPATVPTTTAHVTTHVPVTKPTTKKKK